MMATPKRDDERSFTDEFSDLLRLVNRFDGSNMRVGDFCVDVHPNNVG